MTACIDGFSLAVTVNPREIESCSPRLTAGCTGKGALTRLS